MSDQVTYTSAALGAEQTGAFEAGLSLVRSSQPEHQLLIGDAWQEGGEGRFEERNPARRSETLGTFAAASGEDVAAAVAAARAAQRDWARRPAEQRIVLLEAAAELLRQRGGEIAATATLEVGKNRLESVGEADEAVELIRYYSAQVRGGYDIPLAVPNGRDENVSVLRPFGVFGVIAPFNFPLALVLGPAVAAMLTGNTVVVKPSPTTSGIAVLLAQVLRDAGIPPGVFNLVTGSDSAGRALVDADIDGIVFTGSYAVGQAIGRQFLTRAGFARPCITEMGGKNPTIVTANADLGKAAAGIARSAFALSGQRCSACSRVLVAAEVHDDLVAEMIVEAGAWTVGDPTDPACGLGPVHTSESFQRYEHAAGAARLAGDVVLGGTTLSDGPFEDGYYVQPTIVTDLPVGHELTREELFVPLVVVERVSTLTEALARANDQILGLTAGMFSEDADEVEIFLECIQAGTLFVNRPGGATSGGWPGQQSYTGWKGSGSTNRGGLGPRYVEQFLREQGRNIVRA